MAEWQVTMQVFTQQIIDVVRAIPQGKVLSYGRVAALSGNPKGARQVARILSVMSEKYGLPWHRVLNASGRISLPRGRGYELQQALLESEGVVLSKCGSIDLDRYLWIP